MSNQLKIIFVFLSLLFLFNACGDSGVTDEQEPDKTGKFNGACLLDGSCYGQLVCIENICKYPPELDGDTDGEIDSEPELEPQCENNDQCPPGYDCDGGQCIIIKVDGDEELLEAESEIEEGDSIPAGPYLEVYPLAVDFGSVEVGNISERALQITNSGTENLEITSFKIVDQTDDFGSFEFVGTTNNMTLTVGETATLKIKFTRTADGVSEARLRLESNSVTGLAKYVPLFSNTSKKVNIVLDPEDLIIGEVPVNTQKAFMFDIQNALAGDDAGMLVISDIKILTGNDSFLLANMTFPKELAATKKATIQIFAAPTNPGLIEGSLAIYHNDPTKDYPLIKDLTMIGVVPTLEVSPAQITFGPIPVGNTESMTMILLNQGGDDIEISSINFSALSAGYFSVDLLDAEDALGALPAQIAVGQLARIKISYSPEAFGEHEGVLHIRSNSYLQDDVTIGVTGQGVPPAMTITPGSLDYGCIEVNTSKELGIIIDFQGTGELVVSSAFIEGTYAYSISESPALPETLTEGESMEIKVEYNPLTPSANDINSLKIVLGSGDTITYSIPLSGCGTAANILMEYDENNVLLKTQVVPESIPAMDEMSGTQHDTWVERATFTITNFGQADMQISEIFARSISPANPDPEVWGVDALFPVTVQGSESATFDLLFAPRGNTNYIARAMVCSNAYDANGSSDDCTQDGHMSHWVEISRSPVEYEIFVEPLSGLIEFGQPSEPAPDGFVTKIVNIQNFGSATMHIEQIEILGAENSFFIDSFEPESGDNGWPLTNLSSDKITVNLRFQPDIEGAKTASLVITHNDKDAKKGSAAIGTSYPEYNVTLSGNGSGNTPPLAIVKSPQNVPADPQVGARVRSVEVGENVVLDGTASYDVDDSDFVATYIWTIEEENGFTWLDANRTNPSSLITFSVPGQYHVNLQVTDSHGGKSVQTADSRLQVLVETDPVALACQVNGSCDSLTIPVREVLYLDGTGSTDADGTIDKYRWYIAKRPAGEEELFSTEALPTYIFTDAGYYDIYLEVEDNSGRTSERASLTVSAVENDNVKIEIAWTNGGNVDLHYIRPGHAFGTSGDCNKQNKTPDWEDEGTPQFIQDSLDGSLPEIVVHSNPGDGIYTVRAEYFEATESCGWEEGECSWYEDNCGLCGCSCPSWLCWAGAVCCNSCWQCEQQWVCVDKPTQVTFYIYLNGSASPDMIVTGESYKIPGVPGHVDFSLHRENGKFIVD